MNEAIDELFFANPSASTRFEVIQFMRRVIHKFAFRCWAGEEAGNERKEERMESKKKQERERRITLLFFFKVFHFPLLLFFPPYFPLATQYLPLFKDHFDTIDPELAFVRPIGLLWTFLTRKRREKKALSTKKKKKQRKNL